VLAAEFSRAAATGMNVADTARAVLDRGPLPAEQPAAALRWRLADVLDEREPDHEFVETRQRLAADPLRRMTEDQLRRRADVSYNHLREDPASPELFDRINLYNDRERLAEIRQRHQRLDDTAAAIRAAQAAATEEASAREAHDPIAAKLRTARQALATTKAVRWRTRTTLQAYIDRLDTDLRPLKENLDAAVARSKAATGHDRIGGIAPSPRPPTNTPATRSYSRYATASSTPKTSRPATSNDENTTVPNSKRSRTSNSAAPRCPTSNATAKTESARTSTAAPIPASRMRRS
jgi:hypothetical protein